MFGLAPSMSIMLFVFWPLALISSCLWGVFAFKNEKREEA